MTIINLTQHPATPEQIEAGVVDLPPDLRATLTKLLTFDTRPTFEDVQDRAEAIALLADSVLDEVAGVAAMLGGAPFLMAPLERALIDKCIEPMYAFSRRVSVEEPQPDGSVRKVNIFKHAGFVHTA